MIWVLSREWNFIGYKKCQEQSQGGRRMLVVDRKSEWPNKTRAENRALGRAGKGTEGNGKREGRYGQMVEGLNTHQR